MKPISTTELKEDLETLLMFITEETKEGTSTIEFEEKLENLKKSIRTVISYLDLTWFEI